jgi:hypothetical protein
VCQFKMMIDTKDCQGDLHESFVLIFCVFGLEFTRSWCREARWYKGPVRFALRE